MATLAYTPTSWNGTSINTSQYATKFEDARPGPHNKRMMVAPVEAGRTGKAPGPVRAQPQSETWELTVRLVATDETDVQAMNAIFVEGAQVYLRCLDGAATPVTWRISCHALSAPQRVAGSKALFIVPIRVADPTWEQDTLQTNSQSNQTASPIALGTVGVVANAGTRDAQPKVTFTADVAKGENSHLNDYAYVLRGFLVNRAPKPLIDEPVYLFDQSAAAARLATGTAATGAVVRRTTSATTLTADPGAAGTTIAVTSAAAFNANGGMAIIEWVTGSTFGTMECVYYTGVSGLNLTGCVRGIGGTTAQAHAIGAAIATSGMMPNGDNVRVTVNDSPNQYRNLVAWNSTASDVVIKVDADPAIDLTLRKAMTASVPAVGDTITFVEGNGELDASGFFVCADEVFHYSAKSGSEGVVIDGRALRGTTAATHATTVLCYFKPIFYTVACGWAKADAPPDGLAGRPCTDLPASSNLVQRWGDEASDPLTRYVDTVYPGRPKQWTRGFDKDGNTVSPLMSFNSLPGGVPSAQFKDDVPGDGADPANFIEIDISQGIKAGDANAIQSTYASSQEILNLELFTRDIGGTLKLQDQLQTGAAAANRALPAALAATAYWAKLKARYNIATGYFCTEAVQLTIPSTATGPDVVGAVAMQFRLSVATKVSGIGVRGAASGAGAMTLDLQIFADKSGLPDTLSTDNAARLAFQPITVTGVTVTKYRAPFNGTNNQSPVVLPAGTYWLVGWVGGGGLNFAWQGLNTGSYQYGGSSVRGASVWSPVNNLLPLDFVIETSYLPDGTAPVGPEQPVGVATTGARTGITASIDKTIITLEPLQAVYVHRNTAFVTSGAAGALYHLKGTLANATSGDSTSIDLWMNATATLVIDYGQHTCVYTEGGIAYNLLSILGSSALSLALKPGNNTVTFVDASHISPAQIDLAIEWRGARV